MSMCEAVVVGDDLNALGVVRSLAVGKVPTLILGENASGAAMHSRYGRKVLIAETSGAPLLEALARIGASASQPPVLFLTEEKSVRAVSENRDRILPQFRIRLPDHDVLMGLMDKSSFQATAIRCGSLIPAAVSLKSESDLVHVDQLRFPCVLKPAQKDYAYGARFQKAYVVRNIDEVSQLFRTIAPTLPNLVVQEWIDGDDSDIYFCLVYMGSSGEPVISFSGRKLRSWPPRIGGTASCIGTTDHADVLLGLTEGFFRAVQFTGMGSMEYKRDRRDGRFYMIEPTVGRTDFQEEVATLNGVNIPLASYLHETGGGPFHPSLEAVPRLWREPLTDKWARQQQSKLAEAGLIYKSFDAYYRADDPMPWLNFMSSRLRAKLTHLLGSQA
jgi:predicted ATP-grasp superfamily ATP-dependent carboligase